MADSDKTLKLLIELGVIGQNDAKAVTALLDEAKQGASKLTQANDELGESHEKVATHAGNSKLQHMAIHGAIQQLNQVAPGLGATLNFVARGFHQLETGAQGAAIGTDEFNASLKAVAASLLPLLLLMTAIEAASTLWDRHKEKAKEVEEKNTEMFKRFQEDAKDAFEAWEKFDKAMHPEADRMQEIEEEAKRKQQLLDIELKKNKEILESKEKVELAAATTDEERQVVKAKYEHQREQQELFGGGSKRGIEKQELGEINDYIGALRKEGDEVRQQMVDLQKSGLSTAALAEQLKELTTKLAAAEGKKSTLEGNIETAGAVSEAAYSAKRQVAAQRVLAGGEDETVNIGVRSAEIGRAAGHVNQRQLDSINAVMDVFKLVAGNSDVLKQGLEYAHAHGMNQKQEMKLIRDQLRMLAQQVANGRNNGGR